MSFLIKIHHFMTTVMPTYNGYKPSICLVVTLFLAAILGLPVIRTSLLKAASVSRSYRKVLTYRRIFPNSNFFSTRFLVLLCGMRDMALAEKARGNDISKIIFCRAL